MVSFVDAPGHETLMAIMVSGAAIMDAALLLVAADEECPQPQTREHLIVLKILGIKNIIVVQNKVDLVSKEQAKKNYEQIQSFVTKNLEQELPIIPVSAARKVNIDVLIEAIQELFSTPKREENANPQLLIARSFDINKPGTELDNLNGGVLGGAIIQGKFEVGRIIELRPGIKKEIRNQIVWEPIRTKAVSIVSGKQFVTSKGPGGSVAIATELDPSIVKADSLVGNIAGYPDQMPPIQDLLTLKVELFDKVLGIKEDIPIAPLGPNEPLMISAGTATTLGFALSARENAKLKLKRPICVEAGGKVALSRQFKNRWHLIGTGQII